MSSKNPISGMGRYDSEECKREQAFCLAALDSTDFDGLSDREWIAICEQVARTGGSDICVSAVAAGQDDDE